jgi:hypothetical protein
LACDVHSVAGHHPDGAAPDRHCRLTTAPDWPAPSPRARRGIKREVDQALGSGVLGMLVL